MNPKRATRKTVTELKAKDKRFREISSLILTIIIGCFPFAFAYFLAELFAIIF